MATPSRAERQLMRQRGAGTRHAEGTDADFGLSLEGEGRAERHLMRQRGAGNRHIEALNFGFSFPSPARRSRSKTPTVRNTPRRHSRTPSNSIPGSVRSQRSALPQLPEIREKENATIHDPGRRLSKRRRLSEVSDMTVPPSELPIFQPSEDYVAAMDSYHVNPTHDDSMRSDLYNNVPSSPLFVPRHDANKENEATSQKSPQEKMKPPPKRKKKKSIGQQKKKKRPSVASGRLSMTELEPAPVVDQLEAESQNHDMEEQLDEDALFPNHIDQDVEEQIENEEQENMADESEPSHLGPRQSSPSRARPTSTSKQPRKRRKRKSVTFTRAKKRRSSGIVSTTSTEQKEEEESVNLSALSVPSNLDQDSVLQPQDQSMLDTHQDESEDDMFGPQQPHSSTAPALSRTLANNSDQDSDRDSDDPDHAFMPNEEDLEPPTPAPRRKRQPTNSRKRRSDASDLSNTSAPTTNPSKRHKSTFPITTYQLSNLDALATIPEEEDELNEPHQPNSRLFHLTASTAPTPHDILSQFLTEHLNATIQSVTNTPSTSTTKSRSLQVAKHAALTSLLTTLQTRLQDHSLAHAQRQSLEARLRKSRREKAEMQARWADVRRRRDEAALKADALRRDHWEREREWKAVQGVSDLVHHVEAVREEAEEGRGGEGRLAELEFRAREVAGEVHGAGGVLGRVRAFNRQLESLARSLEGRG